MVLPPSRKDVTGPPPRNVTDLAYIVRHLVSAQRQTDPGLLDGRAITPRPVRPGQSQIVGDDAPGDGSEREWQWEDRYTVTATGTQTPTLTYEPVEESLVVRWHPDGRGAVGDLTNEHFSVDGAVVTISDPGILAVGDEFSFQYQFEDLSDAGEKLDTLTLRDVWFTGSNTAQVLPSLPPLTQAGDFVVIVATWADSGSGAITCTDGRFTAIGPGTNSSNMWVGRADSLADPAFTNTAFRSCIAVAAFVEKDVRVVASDFATASGTVTTLAAPVIEGNAAVAGLMDGHDIVTGAGNLDSTPWTLAVDTGNGLMHAAIWYWTDPTVTQTPTSSASFNGSPGPRTVAVASVEAL